MEQSSSFHHFSSSVRRESELKKIKNCKEKILIADSTN